MSIPERRVNDVGGLPGGAIDRSEHAITLFEQRVDALFALMSNPEIGAFKADALRRAVESCTAEQYATRSYYEKWLYALRDLLIEQNVVDRTELEARVKMLAAAEQGAVVR